ncbi:copper resistance protein C [Actinomycetes bacterium]|nr:copper resistance protein C [Actinomycetes bacterium]
MIKKILALCAALLLTTPINAFAHGEITQATPAADSNVLTAPQDVSIEFDGKLQTIGNAVVNLITVTDNQGQVISSPASVVVGNKISTRLQLTDITGLVSVHYRIVSEDGHPVEGDYSFTVGETPVAINAQDEEAAEAEAGVSEESGSNLLVNGVGILLLIGIVFAVVRRIKK